MRGYKTKPGISRNCPKSDYLPKTLCSVEFIGHGYDDEIGYEFCCAFSSLDEAIDSIEDFLGKAVNDWINHTKTGDYPKLPEGVDRVQGSQSLLADILAGKILLPEKSNFKLKNELLWKTMEEYRAYVERMRRS